MVGKVSLEKKKVKQRDQARIRDLKIFSKLAQTYCHDADFIGIAQKTMGAPKR